MIYLTIPVVTGAIGWVTNWVAVKMLFHPRRPLNLFGWKVQGAIPKRQVALAQSIGGIVERDLFSAEELATQLQNLNVEGEVATMLDDRVARFLDGLAESMPMLQMFLTDSMKEKVSGRLKDEVGQALPDLKQKLSTRVGEEVDLQGIVQEKVSNFSVKQLEKMVLKVISRELRSIEVLGGVLGFLIGVIQITLMSLL